MIEFGRRLRTSWFFFLLVLLATPSVCLSQTAFGDPSLRANGSAIGIGAGTAREKLALRKGPLSVQTTGSQNYSLELGSSDKQLDTEQVYLTGTTTLGRIADIYGIIGQTKVTKPFSGDFMFSGGGGLKISPPQSSTIKFGIVFQAYYFSAETNDAPASLSSFTETGSADVYFSSYGSPVEEKMTVMRYDVLLGFGIDDIPHVRPYAGILFTRMEGTDKISATGQGDICVTPPGGGACTYYSLSQFSAERDITEAKSIGGVLGVTINPGEETGMVIEGQVGASLSISAAAFIRF